MRHASIISILIFLTLLTINLSVFSASSDYIPATVKIGICGDGVAEGIEECDNSDLLGETCISLGYLKGSLTCDPSCNFDKTLCVPIPPPPPDNGDDDDDDNDGENNIESEEINEDSKESFLENLLDYLNPEKDGSDFITLFDTNSNGILEKEELIDSVNRWVNYWKNFLSREQEGDISNNEVFKCDLNKDRMCNLIDFSILMYHFDRE